MTLTYEEKWNLLKSALVDVADLVEGEDVTEGERIGGMAAFSAVKAIMDEADRLSAQL